MKTAQLLSSRYVDEDRSTPVLKIDEDRSTHVNEIDEDHETPCPQDRR
jgi:hypothetical protein